VYDTLLALHLLSAAVAFVTMVLFGAWALGAPIARGQWVVADQAWNISGAGLLIFGVWLALYVDGYELWDGWILGALVLLVAASFFGARARGPVLASIERGGAAGEPTAREATVWHWLRTLSVIGILVLMVWKPGA
jgi:hypothetical protein